MSATRSNWILPGMAIAIFAIFATVMFVAREPGANGRKAGDWFAAAQLDPDQLAKSGAAFVQMEEAGVRYLIRRLTNDLPEWQRKLVEIYNQLGTQRGLWRPAMTSTVAEQQCARKLLGYFEARAVPRLMRLLESPSQADRLAALQALSELGPAAASLIGPRLVRLLNDPDEQVVYEAMTTLAVMSYEPTTVVPLLVPYLQHQNQRVRIEASYALGSYPPMPALTLGALMAALIDTDPVVQGNAARALGQMGAAAAAALERLDMLLPSNSEAGQPRHPLVSARAVEAIGLIGLGLSEERRTAFESAHANHLAGSDQYQRLMVLNASAELGWPMDRLETTASAILAVPQNWQVWETVDVLAKLDPRPDWAMALLEAAAQHPNGLVRAKARRALGR